MASRSPAAEVLADVIGWSGLPKWQPDWQVTERLLGLSLPDDYKALPSTVPVVWLADQGDPNEWPVVAFLIALVRGKLPSNLSTPAVGGSPGQTQAFADHATCNQLGGSRA